MIGFLFSIIILVILGMFMAWAYKRKLRQINKDASVLFGIFFMILFWTFGILFYLNVFNIGVSGENLMWNFPFNFGINPTTANLDGYAIILFLSYPLWYMWGLERGYQLWGRRPYQQGMMFIFRTNKPEDVPDEKTGKKME
ncbi:MAG: hypothetical protein HWN66_15730 [Candidatus Helarchaeota archaeon]|nr:hypothetical protein [Candidatus Helarchaeota archaeon]